MLFARPATHDFIHPKAAEAFRSALYSSVSAQDGLCLFTPLVPRGAAAPVADPSPISGLTARFNFFSAAAREDLDWSEDLRDSVDNGWIDRGGTVFGCDAFNHEHVMTILARRVRDVELGGWIKFDPQQWHMAPASLLVRPSPAQRSALTRIGRFADDPHYRDRTVTAASAFPSGNAAARRRASAAKAGRYEALDAPRAAVALRGLGCWG